MTMKYRKLGRSGVQVSELCLGTMNFGPRTSEADSLQILSRAVDAGINFIDTANQYGGHLGVGTSETIIGKWLAQNRARRTDLVIASKVHQPMSADINDRGLSARHIRAACEASLRRLGTDHIDLYQLHHLDRAVPVDEICQAIQLLVAQGKITYFGTSNFPGWAIAQLGERFRTVHAPGPVAEQSLYNLLERRIELEVIPAAREYGLGVIPWSPLAGGLLAGPTNAAEGRRHSPQSIAARRKHAPQLEAFEALCLELGHDPAAAALGWLLTRSQVAAVIIGPASPEQLGAALRVPDLVLDDATLARLDTIFPPQGEAPEAYAW